MRAPLSWLREYCSPALDTAAIEERLTMTGTKVERTLRHGAPSVEHFVVGRVLSVDSHPDADRLRVCSVDVGADAPAGIVCGAPNVAAGQIVAVALPGAAMPGGMRIKAAKLRGVPSNGMILSAQELEIDTDRGGIMVLDELALGGRQGEAEAARGAITPAPRTTVAPGTALADVLSVGTDVLELEITSNRPDCLGLYGIARELHAATGAPLAPEPWAEDPGSAGALDAASITVRCPELCPRFTARVFEEVRVGPSPLWLKARLSAAGQRPINNVVDITNYAMLLTGQPLHAFDLDRVAGQTLTVRRAHEGEQLSTLDGQERVLDGETIVIEDGDGPTSIAGIMGGLRSEVSEQTTRVLLEVANWSGPSIHRASWKLGLRSEASSRFEKGLAPEQCLWAQAVAARLMLELCRARLVPGTIDIGPSADGWASKAAPIELRERRVAAILGMEVARERQAEILRALDFGVEPSEDGLLVSVPAARRQDVSREADLIEEVARIAGLEQLPATLPARRGAYGRLSERQRLRRRAVDALVGRGLYEIVGWTFAASSVHDRLRLDAEHPLRAAPRLQNPLSADQSLLRTTLLGSLLDAAAHNAARGMVDLRLFELGTAFALSEQGEVDEHESLAVLLSGRIAPASWGAPEPPRADFFAAKAVLAALGAALRVQLDCVALDGSTTTHRGDANSPSGHPFLHPGRAASVRCAGAAAGWLGELHPLVAEAWGIDGAAGFELDLGLLTDAAARQRGYRDLISYPSLRQDLAVVLPVEVPAARALELVAAAGGELLDGVEVFDVYDGEQVGEGRRSLALALSFRAGERTLSDADVVPLRERIVQALEELGGELRA